MQMITFVVGPPRSGTTLLQYMLCNSTGGEFLPECGAVWQVIHYRLKGIAEDYDHEPFDCDDHQLDASVTSFIKSLLGRPYRSENIILKAPNLCHYLDFLHRFFDRSMRTICIIRDPRDAIASLMKVRSRQGLGRDLVAAADFMGSFYQDLARGLDHPHDDNPLFLIRYEDLVSASQERIEALEAFVERPLDFGGFSDLTKETMNKDNPWHSELYGRAVTAERIGAFWDYLTPDEIGAIDHSYGRFYERFGYQAATDDELLAATKRQAS